MEAPLVILQQCTPPLFPHYTVSKLPATQQRTRIKIIVRVDRGDQQQQAEEEHRQHSEGETNSSSEGEFSFAKPDPVEIRTTT